MQTDMHYYGAYAMARAAGLRADVAQVIATAAEYVDDSDHIAVTLADGTRVESRATAHHPSDRANTDPIDQRRTWVPFHFFPGNAGASLDERLICTLDGPLAREMVAHHLTHAGQEYAVLLLGIAAHVYADTFSHYGFSGISSSWNHVDTSSVDLRVRDAGILAYLRDKAERFANQYIGDLVDLVGLGHAVVATYPDRPYLSWSFKYRDGGRVSGLRDNPLTFTQSCEQLHRMFGDFNASLPGTYGDPGAGRDFSAIRQAVADIVVLEATLEDRIAAWQEAAQSGRLYANPGREPIPVYDTSDFDRDLQALSSYDLARAQGTLVYQFITAAEVHRNYVLDDLLPRHGIVLEDASC
jgi:hypothetical protein